MKIHYIALKEAELLSDIRNLRDDFLTSQEFVYKLNLQKKLEESGLRGDIHHKIKEECQENWLARLENFYCEKILEAYNSPALKNEWERSADNILTIRKRKLMIFGGTIIEKEKEDDQTKPSTFYNIAPVFFEGKLYGIWEKQMISDIDGKMTSKHRHLELFPRGHRSNGGRNTGQDLSIYQYFCCDISKTGATFRGNELFKSLSSGFELGTGEFSKEKAKVQMLEKAVELKVSKEKNSYKVKAETDGIIIGYLTCRRGNNMGPIAKNETAVLYAAMERDGDYEVNWYFAPFGTGKLIIV